VAPWPSDESTELVARLRQGRAEAQRDEAQAILARKNAMEQLAGVKRDVDFAKRELIKIKDELRRASESAKTLTRCADESYCRAVDAVVRNAKGGAA
jgi:hypothetical protein